MQPSRREMLGFLGTGLMVAVASPTLAQQRQRRGGGGGFLGNQSPKPISARVHIGTDGAITVMTGKVEGGQGARAEITQAAAEELCVSADKVQLIMGDTQLSPDDGITAGSGTTPRTIPNVRKGAAAARHLLLAYAAKKWNVPESEIFIADGGALKKNSNRQHPLTYADFANDAEAAKGLATLVPAEVDLTPVARWKVMGTKVARPNGRDIATGTHQYPSDITREGMLRAKVLRPPSYGAKLISADTSAAKAMTGVVVVEDADFIAAAAPTLHAARKAIESIEKSANWQEQGGVSSKQLYEHLRNTARGASAPTSTDKFSQTYHVAYIQHAPMEPRAAVAEWADGKATVWTGTQNPFGVRNEIAGKCGVSPENVRVIVPDFGGGFGGKHSGEAAVEAVRIAKAAGKPIAVRWTREEEFTFAYFRPAAVIDVSANLDSAGAITSWRHTNVNSGPQGVETPYKAGDAQGKFVQSEPPLRHGSYRALASTANNFARESAMDELAVLANKDPLEFRLALLDNDRLRAALEAAAKKFNWSDRIKNRREGAGVGLACGSEKGSFVAACAEIAIDANKKISVKHVCQSFDCGAIINPENLQMQIRGAILMGIGPALREAMEFENGKITNASFSDYLVPRFADVPTIDVELLNHPEIPSAGAGETPIICIAPAIANAVYHATGKRVREMPIRL